MSAPTFFNFFSHRLEYRSGIYCAVIGPYDVELARCTNVTPNGVGDLWQMTITVAANLSRIVFEPKDSAAAAIEDEAAATAVHKVKYSGAVPMCGVVGDTELFNQFAAMQVTAQALAGLPSYPTDKWSEISALVTSTLFTKFPSTLPLLEAARDFGERQGDLLRSYHPIPIEEF